MMSIQPIRIMTSNIWGDYFGNPVPPRAALLTTIFNRYHADILGFQEATANWWSSGLFRDLKKNYTAVPTETDGRVNFTPLFYRTSRFELLDSGWHLFHEKLDPSKGWTFAVLKEKESGMVFAVFNTHFWWQLEIKDEVIRRYNAMEMNFAMKQIADSFQCPVFFMGDLNCRYNSSTWEYLRENNWRTSYSCTNDHSTCSSNHYNPVIHEDGTCTGSTTDEPKEFSIDHIGIPDGVKVLRQYAVIDREALDATDHSPIFADVEF